MVARTFVVLLMTALCGTLGAQGTLNITGTIGPNEERIHLIEVDFGAVALADTFSLAISGDSATNGISVFMAELDSLAGLGGAFADSGSDAGTATVNLSVLSGSWDGMHQFVVSVQSNTGAGTVNYNGTFSYAALAAGAATQAAVTTRVQDAVDLEPIFDRAMLGRMESNTGANDTQEFVLDFGSVLHSITFFAQADGDATGSVSFYEISPAGSPNLLGTLNGAGSWSDEANMTTMSYSGLMRIRVVASSGALMTASWSAIFPAAASVGGFTSVDFTGNLAAGQQRFHRFTVDFGATITTMVIMLLDVTVTGSLNAVLVDPSELVVNGTANAIAFDFPFITVTATGVREFFLLFEEDVGAAATYDVQLGVAVEAAGVAMLAPQLGPAPGAVGVLFGQGAQLDRTFTAAGTDACEFLVDFGSTSHSANYWVQGDSDFTGTITVHEVSSTGTATLLTTLTLDGVIPDEANLTLGPRSGMVRLRVTINAAAAGDGSWVVFFDNTVTLSLPASIGGGGGDDGGDDGCTAGPPGAGVLALALVPIIAALRRRRTR